MASFPSLAQLLIINNPNSSEIVLIFGQGFVFTAILWGQVTLSIRNGHPKQACGFFAILGTMAFFGFIHSLEGGIYYVLFFGTFNFPFSLSSYNRA